MMDLIKFHSRKFKTPFQVQRLLNGLQYNSASTLASANSCLHRKSAHCLEGVFVTAAILEHHNYEPLVLSLESQDGLDHCLFVFQHKSRWGSVGKSRDKGLNGRAPVFRSLRDLAWSYFDPYVDHSGKLTAWQVAHLDEVGVDWRYSRTNVWKLEKHLLEIPHHPVKFSKKRYQKLLHHYHRGFDPVPQPYWWE